MCRAHPRSRGENPLTWSSRKRRRGSSPLTRGKRKQAKATKQSTRLIPAHAGKTWFVVASAYTGGAHPRSRGENRLLDPLTTVLAGSSPLTRGKRRLPRMGLWGRGLIPAHAGKTHRLSARQGRGSAHPRSRGENLAPSTGSPSDGGSSPLTRGKLLELAQCLTVPGLIPAHAGKTATRSGSPSYPAAHPRSRGENK